MKKLIGWDNAIFNFKELSKIIICVLITIIVVRFSISLVSGSLLEVITGSISGIIAYLVSFALIMKKDFLYLVSFVKEGRGDK